MSIRLHRQPRVKHSEDVEFIYYRINKDGRAIWCWKCKICGESYDNHRNISTHFKSYCSNRDHTKKKFYIPLDEYFAKIQQAQIEEEEDSEFVNEEDQEEEEDNIELNQQNKALIELIVHGNIAFSSLQNIYWQNFLAAIHSEFSMPSIKNIRKMIISYADEILESSRHSMENMFCSIAIDGATILSSPIYAVILVSPGKVRLYDLLVLENSTSSTISPYIADVYKGQETYGYKITAVTSDNAANMIKAFSTTKEGTVQYLLSEKIMHISCGAHTVQLTIVDARNNYKEFSLFFDKAIEFLSFLKAHKDEVVASTKRALPDFVATRWNSFFHILSYCIDFTTKINEVVAKIIKDAKDANKEIVQPPWTKIPIEIHEYAEPLSAIYEFTNIVEGDFAFEQDLYKAYRKAKDELVQMILTKQNFFAEILLENIIDRFAVTAKLPVAELAYFLTPEGVNEWRNKYTKYFCTARRNSRIDKEEAAEATTMKERMTKILIILCSTLKKDNQKEYITLIQNEFNTWLNSYELPLVEYDTFLYWKEKRNDPRIEELAEVAEVAVSMLASEAVAERLFSMAKSEINKFNKHMGLDLFRALTIIKLCTHYRNAYPGN